MQFREKRGTLEKHVNISYSFACQLTLYITKTDILAPIMTATLFTCRCGLRGKTRFFLVRLRAGMHSSGIETGVTECSSTMLLLAWSCWDWKP